MANPNIVAVTTINGGTSAAALSTTNATSLVSNAASSSTIVKVNNLFVSNVNGVSAATITVSYNNAAAGAGTNYRMAYQISVPANSTLMILDKSGAIYLGENSSLVVQAGTAGYLEVVASYEIIA